MLLKIIDALAQTQTLIHAGQEDATLTDRSGAIVAGGTQQQLLPVNATRSGWLLQNLDHVEPLFIVEMTTLSASAFVVGPGGVFPPPNFPMTINAIQVLGAVTGQAFTCREW